MHLRGYHLKASRLFELLHKPSAAFMAADSRCKVEEQGTAKVCHDLDGPNPNHERLVESLFIRRPGLRIPETWHISRRLLVPSDVPAICTSFAVSPCYPRL